MKYFILLTRIASENDSFDGKSGSSVLAAYCYSIAAAAATTSTADSPAESAIPLLLLQQQQAQPKFRFSQNLAALCHCNWSENLSASYPVCPPSRLPARCLCAAPIPQTRPRPLLTLSGRRPETKKRPFRCQTCELSCSALLQSLT